MRKSVYKGLFKQVDSNGNVYAVQVDDGANSISLDIEVYIEREIDPKHEDLPTQEEYEAAK